MVDTYPSLFWGYTVIVLLIGGYLFFLGRKVKRLEESHKDEE